MFRDDDILIGDVLRREAIHLHPDEASDYDPLLHFIGDKRIVLIGEASHGTRILWQTGPDH